MAWQFPICRLCFLMHILIRRLFHLIEADGQLGHAVRPDEEKPLAKSICCEKFNLYSITRRCLSTARSLKGFFFLHAGSVLRMRRHALKLQFFSFQLCELKANAPS